MYCTKCGKEIPDGEDKLCEECKTKVEENVVEETKKESTEKTGSKTKVIPCATGLSIDKTFPVENHIGIIARKVFPLSCGKSLLWKCVKIALTPSFVNTIPFDAPVVPDE